MSPTTTTGPSVNKASLTNVERFLSSRRVSCEQQLDSFQSSCQFCGWRIRVFQACTCDQRFKKCLIGSVAPEVHLKENGRKCPSWYQTSWKEEDEIGTGAIQTHWPLMRHQVRVKESKELKVAEERNLECSRGTSTLLRMISGVSETSCLERRVVLGKTYKTNQEADDKVHELNQQASKKMEILAL